MKEAEKHGMPSHGFINEPIPPSKQAAFAKYSGAASKRKELPQASSEVEVQA